MKEDQNILGKLSSIKIVLLYAAVSGIYIYTSDYFLDLFVSDIIALSKLQTFKGLGFILITSTLLYVLVKRNNKITSSYYRQLINAKIASEEQAKISNAEYMSLFDHSPIPMWMFDRDSLRFLIVNDAACDHYGFSHEEFLKMTLLDIRPFEEIPAF